MADPIERGLNPSIYERDGRMGFFLYRRIGFLWNEFIILTGAEA
jgi:hypothetical protein